MGEAGAKHLEAAAALVADPLSHTGRGNIHIQWVPPRNHPGETVYPQEPPGISSSGPKDKMGGVSGNACADSGLKS